MQFMYVVENTNPRPNTICPECRRLIGTTYADTINRPRLPRHADCYCYYRTIPIQNSRLPPESLMLSAPLIQEILHGPPTT